MCFGARRITKLRGSSPRNPNSHAPDDQDVWTVRICGLVGGVLTLFLLVMEVI